MSWTLHKIVVCVYKELDSQLNNPRKIRRYFRSDLVLSKIQSHFYPSKFSNITSISYTLVLAYNHDVNTEAISSPIEDCSCSPHSPSPESQSPHTPSTASLKESWSAIQSNVMASTAPLASMTSIDPHDTPQKHQTTLPAVQAQNQVQATVQCLPLPFLSRHLWAQPLLCAKVNHKCLMPSSIPFFRCSSSQSMHISTSTAFPSCDSLALSSAQMWNVKSCLCKCLPLP